MESVPEFHTTFDWSKDSTEQIQTLTSQVVPAYKDAKPADIAVAEVSGGITNKLFKAKYNDIRCLIRVYGENTELLINRSNEMDWMSEFQPLYGRFNNGIVYTFIVGITVGDRVDLLKDDSFLQGLGRFFAQYHHRAATCSVAQKHEQNKKNFLEEKFEAWWELCLKTYDSASKFTPKQQEVLATLNFKNRKSEVDALKNQVQAVCRDNAEVCSSFCHNDTLLGNIIYNEETQIFSFIDFEYTAWNYALYDVANHFDEWMGIDPEQFDISKYPNPAQQTTFLKAYLGENNKLKGVDPPTDHMVEKARRICLLLSLASHCVWGMWALIQADNSKIAFDYVDYARVRLSAWVTQREKYGDLLPTSK